MQYLRYNTDSQEVVFGIFVDSTDGNTEETGLTIANTDIKIWKAGATTLANKNSGGATHISNGIYYAVFDSTDTNTLGSGKAFVHVSGALYTILEFCVLPQKVYDSMIAGSDNLEVDTIQIEGSDATNQLNAATPSVTVSDKTGFSLSSAGVSAVQSGLSTFDPSSDTVARVTLVDTCTTNTDMRGTDGANTTAPDNASITAIKAKTDSLTFTTPLKVDATATVSTEGLATEAKQDTMITHLTDIKGSTLTAQQVWEYTTRTLSAFGFSVTVGTNNDKTGYSLSATPPTAAAIADAVWDETTSGHSTSGTAGAAIIAAGSAGDPWSASLPGAYSSGTAGNIIGNRIDAAISSRSSHSAADVWSVTTRTLSSFGSLVSDIVSGVWGAATRTLSAFGFTVTASSVTDKTGYSLATTPPTAAQIRSEIDSNSTQLAAIIANIAALNNVSTSQVLAQVQSALNTYDAPTKAELDSAVSTLATSSELSTVAGYIDTEITSIKAVTDKLDTALEADSTVYRFTLNALENAPSGGAGGGDATAENQTTIINHLTEIKGSGFTSTDTLESIRDKINTITTDVSGSNLVTIVLEDNNNLRVNEAKIEIWDEHTTNFQTVKESNSSGQAIFPLSDGTYTVVVRKSGYSFTNYTLIVPDTLNITITGASLRPLAPLHSELCVIYGYFFDAEGRPFINNKFTATLTVTNIYEENNSFYYSNIYGKDLVGTYNSITGLLTFTIVRGVTVKLTIPMFNIDKSFTVSDSATMSLDTIL